MSTIPKSQWNKGKKENSVQTRRMKLAVMALHEFRDECEGIVFTAVVANEYCRCGEPDKEITYYRVAKRTGEVVKHTYSASTIVNSIENRDSDSVRFQSYWHARAYSFKLKELFRDL